ncbi:MAG: metal-dependent hydrolase [Thermodesulfovibrionales bacterium]|nr:metal-dependent hydrolase [Thermodesulfovibrionales bacterium]
MDPVTHALAGITIKNLGFKRRAALWVALFASVAPDLDYITRFWGVDVFLRYHRGITHGILALLAVSLVIGLIFGLRKGFLYYFSLSALAYGFHILLDLINQYGVRLMSPLNWQAYSLDLAFIIDPYVSIGLLAGVVFAAFNKKRAVAAAYFTLMFFGLYAGGRYYLHEKAEDFLRHRLDESTCTVCPLPNDFLRWWFVARSKDGVRVGFADMFTGRICFQETYPPPASDPLIEMSKQDRVVKNFLYFAKYPYPEVKRQNGAVTVKWKELSYSFMADEHFTATVVMDEKGRVLKSYFKF